MNKLTEALRQYRHNDSDDFVFGYDKEVIDQLFVELGKKLEQKQRNVDDWIAINRDLIGERDQLKAHNTAFREAVEYVLGIKSLSSSATGCEAMSTMPILMDMLHNAYITTPSSCLADIQAKAIEGEIYYLKTITIGEKSLVGVSVSIDVLTRRAERIRQQATKGSSTQVVDECDHNHPVCNACNAEKKDRK